MLYPVLLWYTPSIKIRVLLSTPGAVERVKATVDPSPVKTSVRISPVPKTTLADATWIISPTAAPDTRVTVLPVVV